MYKVEKECRNEKALAASVLSLAFNIANRSGAPSTINRSVIVSSFAYLQCYPLLMGGRVFVYQGKRMSELLQTSATLVQDLCCEAYGLSMLRSTLPSAKISRFLAEVFASAQQISTNVIRKCLRDACVIALSGKISKFVKFIQPREGSLGERCSRTGRHSRSSRQSG